MATIYVKIPLGNKNQKKPTLTVKKKGNTRVIKVISKPNPSRSDQTKSINVTNPKTPIEINLKLEGKNNIPIKPREQRIEEMINLFLFDIIYLSNAEIISGIIPVPECQH